MVERDASIQELLARLSARDDLARSRGELLFPEVREECAASAYEFPLSVYTFTVAISKSSSLSILAPSFPGYLHIFAHASTCA